MKVEKESVGQLMVIFLLVMTVINFVFSTVYYNWIDHGMREIQEDFSVNGPGTGGTSRECNAPCKGVATYYSNSSVLKKRDDYCAEHNIARFGGWYIKNNVIFESQRVDTFSFYFKLPW